MQHFVHAVLYATGLDKRICLLFLPPKMGKLAYKFKRTPMPHQVVEFRHHLSTPFSATWSETGAGKTFPMLAATEFRFQLGLIKSCLYTAPNSILEKIESEVHLNTNLTCTIIRGYSRKKRIKLLDEETDIHIINYEALAPFLEFLTKKYDCVIADEAHRAKGYNSGASKALQKIGSTASFRIAATGTPLCTAPEDMYGIYRFIDKSVFGTRVSDFRDRWCHRVSISLGHEPGARSFEKTKGIRKGTEEAFREKCLSLAVLHEKDQCLNLPPKIVEVRNVSLTSGLSKIYASLKKNLIKLPNGEVMELTTGGARYAKAAQICSGFIKHGDTIFELPASNKLKELDDILSSREDKKTVVWCRHVHVIKTLLMRYGQLSPTCQMGGQDNALARNTFQEDDDCRLIINQLNICDGYELTASDCAVYFEMPWQWQAFKQSQDRTHRKGSERHKQIMYFYLITNGTMEKSVLAALDEKKNLADIIPGRDKEVINGTYSAN